jgi:hypothetical protein
VNSMYSLRISRGRNNLCSLEQSHKIVSNGWMDLDGKSNKTCPWGNNLVSSSWAFHDWCVIGEMKRGFFKISQIQLHHSRRQPTNFVNQYAAMEARVWLAAITVELQIYCSLWNNHSSDRHFTLHSAVAISLI